MTQVTPGEMDPLGLTGIIPPTVTAFDSDGALDEEATAAHAQFVVEGGANGVFPLGTNGEFAMLSGPERKRVVEAVTEGVEAPVIAGVGTESTRQTVEHAEHAESVGADGVVVVTPYYYPLDEQAALDHYSAVAAAVDVPVYIYHIPGRTGNKLSPSTVDALAEVDGIAGLKDSSKDVPWLAQAIDRNPELTFLAGSDSLLLTGLQVGCSGTVSAIANAFPELVVECHDAFADGDTERAREIQSMLYRVRSALKDGPYMSGVKTALSLRDLEFDVGGLRSPLRTMDEEETAQLEATLTDLGVL